MNTSITYKKPYNLGDRTILFATEIRAFIHEIPNNYLNRDDLRQLLRSSGSVAANYAEANEAESKKDFAHKCKLCRKESKECHVWLTIFVAKFSDPQDKKRLELAKEALELTKIFTSIIRKMNQDHVLYTKNDKS